MKDPFKERGQLLSIHAFVQKDGNRKQFPLAFAVMSRKTKADYVTVLQALKDKTQNPMVESFVLDCKKAAWQAVRDVFPTRSIQGCVEARRHTDTFRALQQRANTPALHRLLEYVDNQWFRNAVFSVAEWCVSEKTIRNNNECEGWHNWLNSKAGRLGLTFYRLAPLLRRKAEAVAVRVSGADLEREINRGYIEVIPS